MVTDGTLRNNFSIDFKSISGNKFESLSRFTEKFRRLAVFRFEVISKGNLDWIPSDQVWTVKHDDIKAGSYVSLAAYQMTPSNKIFSITDMHSKLV